MSEPESPVVSISSSQTRMSLSERFLNALALLRQHNLSPFDSKNLCHGEWTQL
jgi:hypothetical protein